MVLHCTDGLPMLIGMFQDLVTRHDPTLGFIQDDLSTKFHQRSSFVPGDGPRVRLEEAEHFLIGSHLLALEYPAARLRNDALDQWEHRLALL